MSICIAILCISNHLTYNIQVHDHLLTFELYLLSIILKKNNDDEIYKK